MSRSPPTGTKWTKPANPAVAVVAEREHGVAVVGVLHVVEGHREAALRLAVQPGVAHACRSRRAARSAQLARAHDAAGVAGLAQARDRLAHLADRPALERERGRPHDRLVADVQGAQPGGFQVARWSAPTPITATRQACAWQWRAKSSSRAGDCGRVADRVAGDERHPADGAVGQEGRSLVVEEVRLVAAQREVGERVAASPRRRAGARRRRSARPGSRHCRAGAARATGT